MSTLSLAILSTRTLVPLATLQELRPCNMRSTDNSVAPASFRKPSVPSLTLGLASEHPMIADFRGGATCLIDPQLPARIRVRRRLTESGSDGDRSGGPQGHTRRTGRPSSHGTGRVGAVSPASFNSGL